jgi:uncharacterized protein (DUF362 family)
MPTSALVALIRSAPATALDDFERLMQLAQFRRRLDPRVTALLKPDARRHYPFPGANTTPWQLEGVVRALRAADYYDVVWKPPRRHLANMGAGEDLNGYLPLLREYHVTSFHPSDVAARNVNLVLLPTLKTDAATMIGGALWCLLDERLLPHAITQHEAHEQLAGALAANREKYTEIFAVMDCTTISVGPRPYILRPEVRGVLLASADPLALDAVAARLMGFDPLRDIAYMRLAHERGLGVADSRAIELVGDTDLARERWRSLASRPCWLRAPRPLEDLIGRILERVRWSTVERPVFESWLRGTPWGRLFAHYQRIGYGRSEEQILPLAGSGSRAKTQQSNNLQSLNEASTNGYDIIADDEGGASLATP